MTYGHLLYAIQFAIIDIRNNSGDGHLCHNIADAIHNLPEGVHREVERGVSADEILKEVKGWQTETQNATIDHYIELARQRI